jgi:hypothetical protein
MPRFKGRHLELSAALTLLSAACGTQVTLAPPGLPRPSSTACHSRVATVKNPTTGDVNVFVERRIPGGYTNVTKLGTVNAGTTGEFELSVDDGTSLQIEWAPGAGAHAHSELGKVRSRIRCQTPRSGFPETQFHR